VGYSSDRSPAESAQDVHVPGGRPDGTGRVRSWADAGEVRCVIVDDNDGFIHLASVLLVLDGLDVVGAARNRVQGLRLVVDACPNVALVDLHLGQDSGIELVADIVRAGLAAQMFMILVSACAEDDLREAFGLSAADGYLPKMAVSGDAVRDMLRGNGHNKKR
jgi:DNA-binding NarL/FixJ family response regulator